MKNMKQLLNNLINEDSGQDLIEYALVAALVGLGAVAAMKGLSNSMALPSTAWAPPSRTHKLAKGLCEPQDVDVHISHFQLPCALW